MLFTLSENNSISLAICDLSENSDKLYLHCKKNSFLRVNSSYAVHKEWKILFAP